MVTVMHLDSLSSAGETSRRSRKRAYEYNITSDPLLSTNRNCNMLVTLPHLLKDWPVEGTLCSHYKAVSEAHNAWVKDSGFFSPKQTYALLKLDATLLCSMLYPDCDEVMLRLLSDLFAVSFLFDDHFERSKAEDVLEQTKAFGRAYR